MFVVDKRMCCGYIMLVGNFNDGNKMKRTLYMGDVHGHFSCMELWAKIVQRHVSIDEVVVVGDFGFWPGVPEYYYVTNRLGVPLRFIDGNHENHELLKIAQEEESFESSRISEEYDAEYIPRGTYQDGVFFMGGATSIDKWSRTPGIDWFPGEAISTEDFYRAADVADAHADDVKVMVAHDTTEEGYFAIKGRHDIKYEYGKSDRLALESLHGIVQPKLFIHGHHHFHAVRYINGCTFVSLDQASLRGLPGFLAAAVSVLDIPSDDLVSSPELLDYARRCCVVADSNGTIIPF